MQGHAKSIIAIFIACFLAIALLAARAARAGNLSPDEVLAEVRALDVFRANRIANAPRIPDSAYRTAATGRVSKAVIPSGGSAAGKAWGVYVSNVPVETFWKAINDEPHVVGWLPVDESAVLQGRARGNDALVFQYISVPVPGVSDRYWITRGRFNAQMFADSSRKLWELSWTQDKNASLAGTQWESKVADAVLVPRSDGSWLLIPLTDGRTVVEYTAWSDPGGNIPVWVTNRLGAGAIADSILGAEKMARQHIPSCSGPFYYPDGSRMP
jgi:hypothetical protein